MAAEYVHIRHPRTREEKRIASHTVPFFTPEWEVVVNDEPPAKNASTDVWRKYATDNGLASDEQAAAMSRDELIALVPATTTEEN